MKTVNQTKETTKTVINERLRKSHLQIGDLVIPVLVFIILILLATFVFIPMINAAINFRNESKEINRKMEILEKLEEGLEGLDNTLLQADLIVAKRVIPNTLKVSSFIYYIDTLANSKNLSSKELTAGDVKILTGGDRDNPDYTYAVNGPLSYTGSFGSILSFLDELQVTSPYIISIENISLRESENDMWNVSLTVTGYYIPDQVQNTDLYLPFSSYNKHEETMKILRQKSEKLEN